MKKALAELTWDKGYLIKKLTRGENIKKSNGFSKTKIETKLDAAPDKLENIKKAAEQFLISLKNSDLPKKDPKEFVYLGAMLQVLLGVVDYLQKSRASNVNTETEVPQRPTNVPSNINNLDNSMKK